MITGRSIICFANDWHGDPTSKHQIMRVLARGNTILWINSIGLRRPTLGKRDMSRMAAKLRSFSRGAERVGERFYVFTPIVIPFHHSRFARAVNAALLDLSIRWYRAKLKMRDAICWSYMPNVDYIIKRMKPSFVIYHCVDEWSKFSFIDDKILEKEEALCRMADLVIASARTLYESRLPWNPHTHYLPHGVDYDYFHSSPEAATPPDLESVPKPIAGFFGLIHEWIDLDLLDSAIRRLPGVSFVFIGECSVDVSKLASLPNAYFLGQKPYRELVSYARRFDIGLVPFKINELTVNVNPIKLKEYLALGIPVVSVDLPEVRAYGSVVNTAADREEFVRAIERELAGEHRASREEIDRVAREETWDRKVEEISNLIEERMCREAQD
jgi:glycosyltransferase involved in cell wall biosynthesis